MQYNSIPVFSNGHLLEELRKLESNPHLRSLIFINCGGMLDQTQLWYYQQAAESRVRAFIFDSHRPYNHNNMIDHLGRLFIVHDGCHSFNKYPTSEDIQVLEECGGDSDEDDEDDDYDAEDEEEREEAKEELADLKDNGSSEGEEEDEDVYGGDRVQKRRIADDEDEGQAEVVGAEDDVEEVDGIKVGVKRPREEEPAAMSNEERRALKRKKKAII